MKKITLTCETITPMFLAGADGSMPELRAPSIKGTLRFWWRAMNGHLSLEELKKQEAAIFGGTDKEQGRSKVIIQIPNQELLISSKKPVPHKHFKSEAFNVKQTFTIMLSLIQDKVEFENKIIFDLSKLQALFLVTCVLGGFGKRSRRGMGSVRIKAIDEKSFECVTINDIYHQINKVNQGKFRIDKNSIYSQFKHNERYPYVKRIELGDKEDNDYLFKISNATHQSKLKNRYLHEKSMGYASREGRFSSPIYVSIIEVNGKLKPIITTLNAVSDKGHADTGYQQNFKNAILL